MLMVIIPNVIMLYNIMLGIVIVSIITMIVITLRAIMPNVANLSVILLNGIMSSVIAWTPLMCQCHFTEYRYAECHCAGQGPKL